MCFRNSFLLLLFQKITSQSGKVSALFVLQFGHIRSDAPPFFLFFCDITPFELVSMFCKFFYFFKSSETCNFFSTNTWMLRGTPTTFYYVTHKIETQQKFLNYAHLNFVIVIIHSFHGIAFVAIGKFLIQQIFLIENRTF